MGTPESGREPTYLRPGEILLITGGMFVSSTVGKSVVPVIKRIFNPPAMRAGAKSAVFVGALSASYSALVYSRQKEDRWNLILSSSAAFGLLETLELKFPTLIGRGPPGLPPNPVGVAIAGGALFGLLQEAYIRTILNKKKSGQSVPENSSPRSGI